MRSSLGTRVAFLRPRVALAAVLAGVAVSGMACDTQRVVESVERAIAAIRLTPGAALVRVGTRVPLAATPVDPLGVAVPNVTITWAVEDTAVARVTPTGDLWGRAPGHTTVRATALSGTTEISATAGVDVTLVPVATVTVSPAPATVVVGSALQLVAVAADSAGQPLVGRAATWSSNSAAATVSQAGVVIGVSAGQATMTAVVEGRSGTSVVTVNSPPAPPPVVTQIVLTPASVTLASGATQQFTAVALMSNGTQQPAAVTYAGTGGSITGAGFYTAGSSGGNYRVIATQQGGTLADTAAITVTAPPPPPPPPVVTRMDVTPATVTLATAATQQFAATEVLSDGSSRTATGVTWTATGGTITAAGLYTAGSSGGSFRAIGTKGAFADTAAVTITAPPPPPVVTRMDVTPATVTLATGTTRQFAATEVLSDGSSRTATGVTWTATGGTITAAGLYTAGSSGGSFRAIGTKGAFADTAAVTITAPPVVTRMDVTPATVTLATAATQQFAATEVLSDGSSRTATGVTWTATGGTITAAGLYTAGSSGGSFRAIGTKGAFADTSAITVTAPPPPPPPCTGTCSLDWFEDFRSGTLTARGLVREASNATVVMVSSSGLGFPSGTVNVARNVHAGALDVQWVANNLWRAPAVGEYVFLRMYIRNSLPNGANTGADHGNQCNVGDVKWAWLIEAGSGGTYDLDVANSAQSNIRLASGIPKGSVQRLEWRLSRTSSTSGVVTFRVYSSTGTLLGEGTRNMSGMTDALYRTARWGLSGQAGASYVGNGIEWGNLAARVSGNSNDWIGAYPVAGVEQ